MLAALLVGATAAGDAGSGVLTEIGAGGWVNVAVSVAHIIGSVLVCCFVYRYAPADRLSWRDAARGGLVAGLLIQLTPFVVAIYVRSTNASVGQVFVALTL